MAVLARTGLPSRVTIKGDMGSGKRFPGPARLMASCWKAAESGTEIPATRIPVLPQRTVLIEWVTAATFPQRSTTTTPEECPGWSFVAWPAKGRLAACIRFQIRFARLFGYAGFRREVQNRKLLTGEVREREYARNVADSYQPEEAGR